MRSRPTQSLQVIDSHTEGEPTRTVVAGAPSLGSGTMRERRELLRAHADWIRTSLTLEPRGAPWMVGALLQEPVDPTCAAGVIFFNNGGYLNMCGHGLIGVVTTLGYQGRISAGAHRIETPAGVVTATLADDGSVAFDNVLSFRRSRALAIDVPQIGTVVGDVAFGGNWFFLTTSDKLDVSMIAELTWRTSQIKIALVKQGVRGDSGGEIDHIEVFGPPSGRSGADARSFVLCPGEHYDRSPCGTGTSEKLACLAEDGKLAPGEIWLQESIVGTVFEASYRRADGGVIPTIRGRAFITAETTLVLDSTDPFRYGLQLVSEIGSLS